MPRRPPSDRHFMAATALAKVSVHSKGQPRTSPTAQAPWKTSPAPLVSTTGTAKPGARTHRPFSRPSAPSAASVAATRAGPRAAKARRPSSTSAWPVTWATNRGVTTRPATAGQTWSIPSTTRSPSMVTRIPAARAQPMAWTAAAAAVSKLLRTWRTPCGKEEHSMAKIEKSIDVDVPVQTAYNQWTQFEDFPEFMEGVLEVKQLGEKRLLWWGNVGGRE